MRYRESREQSAEILRIALGHMGRQQAAFHPASYTLWYEHAAGTNPELSQALAALMASKEVLTDADVWSLFSEYILARNGEAIERIHERLVALLQETARTVESTGTHAVQFGDTLEDHSQRLSEPVSQLLIQSIVNDLLSETRHMSAANAALSRQLNTSSQEVLSLTQKLERLQVEAFKDPLTGLLNRRGFEHGVIAQGARFGDLRGTSLLVADVDHFKKINDAHGHLAGDEVLRAVAQVLRARIKGSDVAARLGGDEFVVLLPRTPLVGALALAEQIRSTLIEGRLRRGDRQQHIDNLTLSVGVAEARCGERLEDLLHRADAALYAAKRTGRNRVSCETSSDPSVSVAGQ